MRSVVGQVVLAGLVCGLGLGFPWAFHQLGGVHLGPVLLPMFLPIVAGAFFLRPLPAVFVGGVTPLLSGLLTNMPPLAPPIAFLMAGELATMALIISVMSVRLEARRTAGWLRRLPTVFEKYVDIWPVLAVAVLADRLILAALAAGLSKAFGLPPLMVTWISLVVGLPGIVLQFVVIPPLVSRLRSSTGSTDD